MTVADLFRYDDNSRLFYLHQFGYDDDVEPSDVCGHQSGEIDTFVRCDYHPRVIFVDGSCRSNGQYGSRGGYGVWFGPNSSYNVSNPLKSNTRHTNQRAELTACLVALNQIEKFHLFNGDSCSNTYIIATDSAYLVNAMTSYVYTWNRNGYRTSMGTPVENQDLIRRIDSKLDAMAYGRQDIDVLFWKIDRSENQEADELAKDGADRV